MKKVIGIILSVAILSSVGAAAFAASDKSGASDQASGKTRQRIVSMLKQRKAVKTAIAPYLSGLKTNAKDNSELTKQIKALRQDIQSERAALKESGTVLSDETKTALKAYTDQLTASAKSLKDTQGQIKDLLKDCKGYLKDKNYEALKTAASQIEAIQAERQTVLTQMIGVLQSIKALLAA